MLVTLKEWLAVWVVHREGDQAVGAVLWWGCGVGGCGCTSYRVVIVLGVADRERLSVVQAYRFALDLTPRQERVVLAHAGAARVAHNWALARVKAVMDQRAAERTYGIDEVDLTPTQGWSLPALRRAWNSAKADVAPWWAECSKEAFNTGLDALARGVDELVGLPHR